MERGKLGALGTSTENLIVRQRFCIHGSKDARNNILHLARFFVFMEAIHARGFGVIISV